MLLKSVRVVDSASAWHGQRLDISIVDGEVEFNPTTLPTEPRVFAAEDLCVSPGWVDIGTGISEPGFEQRETLAETLAAAAKGGFTRVLALPTTQPVVDERGTARAILSAAAGAPCALELIGALSEGGLGKQLAAYGDLKRSGIRHFGDGLHPIADAKLLALALQYSEPLGGTVLAYPGELRLQGDGQINEGKVSTLLGLRGIPLITEEIGLSRDLKILSYAGGRLLVHAVSTAASVRHVLEAQRAGHNVACTVPVMNLAASDEALLNYDVNAKVLPPLRSEETRQQLVASVLAGDPHALVSGHQARQVEEKLVEFSYASPGAATISKTFSLALEALGDADLIADYFGRKNRVAAGWPAQVVGPAAQELTFYSPVETSVSMKPKTANVPFLGREMIGRVIGTYANQQFHAH